MRMLKKLVNSALVSIHIDGYKVSPNPISFQGRDVAVQDLHGVCPMVRHIGALEKVGGRALRWI